MTAGGRITHQAAIFAPASTADPMASAVSMSRRRRRADTARR